MSRVSRWLLVGAAVVVACVLFAGPATAQSSGADNATLSPDSTLIRIDAAADGTASWEIQYQFYLTDPGEREAFTSYRQDIEANRSTYLSEFAADIRPSVRQAENETGREMALSNVTVAVRRQRLGQDTGIVTYRFAWTGFVAGNDSRLLIGDAISGFYLGPNTRLTVTWPEDYRLDRVSPDPTARRVDRVAWDGELGFASEEPRIVAAADGTGPTADGFPLLPVGLAVVALAVGAAGVYFVRHRTAEGDDDGAVGAGSAADTAAAGTDGDDSDDRPPEDLLSDDERALTAVRDHGGRLKQQELADACDWGDSKTSRVVNRLRDDDRIEVFRLGRENVITLPEESYD